MKKYSANFKIAVVGLYHLGSVVSIGLASLKKQVVGLDSDKRIIDNLTKNKVPLYELGLENLLKLANKNISFSTDFSILKDIDCLFFTQDTETNGSGSIKKLSQLIDHSLPYLKQDVTIIIMSQVPIGFHRNLLIYVDKKRPDLKFRLYHWVDTIIMTKALYRFLNPERIIIGSQHSPQGYSPELNDLLRLFKCHNFNMSFESAEITKAAINLYLAASATFANTLSDFCEVLGADIEEVIPALQSDKRIGPFSYLKPNLRIAGGHLERDLLMLKRLASKKKMNDGIVSFILKQNEVRYRWLIKKLKNLFPKNHKKITLCLWGLSYKKNSESTENAASILIIKSLSKDFIIHTYDPKALMPKHLSGYKRFNNKYYALKRADVLVILTDWDEFKKLELNEIRKNLVIIDCVRVLSNFNSKSPNYIALGKSMAISS